MSNTDFSFEIVKQCGIITTNETGWTKELNLVSWNGKPPKYDIRDWNPEHDHMGRGITLSPEEATEVFNLLAVALTGEE